MIVYSASSKHVSRIHRVQFHVLSPQQIRDMSVVEITETAVYQRGLPAMNGIQDARMGTVDRRILCATCNMDMVHCQGHSGHIELPWPMYHSIFFETVLKTLRSVCFMCSRLCQTPDDDSCTAVATGQSKARFNHVYAASKVRRRCPHCGTMQPTLVRQSMGIKVEWPTDMEWESEEERAYCTQPFTQRDAYSILRGMTDADCAALGFNPTESHPKHMVMTVLLVPTPTMRPTISASQGSKTRANDDITQKLQDICKRVHDVRNHMEGKTWQDLDTISPALTDRISRLQYEVFTIVSNTVRGQRPSVQRSGIPTKSYIGRIKGKDGRIRGNLMGKRVDHCARCVISPGPLLDIDQVGIPKRIAMGLTVPEVVTEFNIASLTERVRIGADDIRGAETVITSDGVVIHLAQCTYRQQLILVYGWTVERYLQRDDVVAFNRQPSLHKLGLMGHRVVLVDDLTMRLNLSVTAPYNADFDGDEMNLHVPQGHAARAAVKTLMMVSRQIISPQANKPCIGIVQDSLVGAYRMTRISEFFTQSCATHILAHLLHCRIDELPPPAIMWRGVGYWTGMQLVSLLFPDSLRMDRERMDIGEADPLQRLVVHRGNMLSGRLNKSVLGTASGGIVDVMVRIEGCRVASEFLSDLQRMMIAYNERRGFSVGIRDCIIKEEGSRKVNERIATATQLANDISDEMAREDMTADDIALGETTVRRILGKALTQAGSIVESLLDENNAIRTMVLGGSKGSLINLSQIHACVGQQSVEGRRISAERETRTLSCFRPNDRSLRCQGFVKSSYIRGLEPYEFFYHGMGGREGIVDTAVKTAATGYIQRRQVKAMESHRVSYDGTVRNSSEGIVQFLYSGMGFDPSRLERVRLPCLLQSIADIRARHSSTEAERILLERNIVLESMDRLGCELDDRVTLPFDPMRFVQRLADDESRDVDESLHAASDFLRMVGDQASALVRLACHAHFPESMLLRRSASAVRKLCYDIRTHVEQANVDAGEMVGCIAAQSIGEPTTQMSLRGDEIVLVRDSYGVRASSIADAVNLYCNMGTQPSDLQVVAVSPEGTVQWADVLGVSRHPANGPMLRVRTASGRSVVGTASHSYLVRNPRTGRIDPIRGDQLHIGDEMPIASRLPQADPVLRSAGLRATGRTPPGDSALSSFMIHAPWFVNYLVECQHRSLSFLQGVFDTSILRDGIVIVKADDLHVAAISAALLCSGIPHQKMEAHTWLFAESNVAGLINQVWWDTVASIDNLGPSNEQVYDFTVDQNLQSFMLINGLFVHNTLNVRPLPPPFLISVPLPLCSPAIPPPRIRRRFTLRAARPRMSRWAYLDCKNCSPFPATSRRRAARFAFDAHSMRMWNSQSTFATPSRRPCWPTLWHPATFSTNPTAPRRAFPKTPGWFMRPTFSCQTVPTRALSCGCSSTSN